MGVRIFEEFEEPVDGLHGSEPRACVAELQIIAPAFCAPSSAEFLRSPFLIVDPPAQERFRGQKDFIGAAAAQA